MPVEKAVRYIQRVAAADLGTFSWNKMVNGTQVYYNAVSPIADCLAYDTNTRANAVCSDYAVRRGSVSHADGSGISLFYYSGAYTTRIYDDTAADAEELAARLAEKNVKLVYELAEPIVTDVTGYTHEQLMALPCYGMGVGDACNELVFDEFDLDVEAGGSLTFRSGEETPVPNRETYLIKLGGTV